MQLTDLPSDDPRPLLLLDVDGVLNVINRKHNIKRYTIFRVEIGLGAYTIRIRKETPDWLAELVDHYVLAWATMWNDDANTYLLEALGLPELPVVECDGMDVPLTRHHKWPSIERQIPEGRAFAWIDDEFARSDHDWAELRTDKGSPTFLIKTSENQGIQRFHVDRLIAWSKEVRKSS